MTATTFTVSGRPYELARVDTFSYEEHRVFKAIAGMPAGRIEAAQELDPDYWAGLLVVSMRRTNPQASPADLSGVNLVELAASFGRSDPEDDARPPAHTLSPERAAPSGESAANEHLVSEGRSPEEIPVDDGTRPSSAPNLVA